MTVRASTQTTNETKQPQQEPVERGILPPLRANPFERREAEPEMITGMALEAIPSALGLNQPLYRS